MSVSNWSIVCKISFRFCSLASDRLSSGSYTFAWVLRTLRRLFSICNFPIRVENSSSPSDISLVAGGDVWTRDLWTPLSRWVMLAKGLRSCGLRRILGVNVSLLFINGCFIQFLLPLASVFSKFLIWKKAFKDAALILVVRMAAMLSTASHSIS